MNKNVMNLCSALSPDDGDGVVGAQHSLVFPSPVRICRQGFKTPPASLFGLATVAALDGSCAPMAALPAAGRV